MNKEVVDFGHEVIDATIIVVPNPREKVVDGFLQGMFEVRSKASSLRANRLQGARIEIKTNETVSSHEKVPVATGTFVSLQLAVSQAEILLRLEERLDTPAHPVGANNVLSRCVDLVRGEVLDRILFIFVGRFLGDNQLHVSQLGDGKLLHPDVVGLVFDVALSRVDALLPRIDANRLGGVRYLAVTPERVDPVLAVGFDVFRKARIVAKSRVEEVGVPADTYLFFEFGDDLAGKIVLGVVILVVFVLFFVEAALLNRHRALEFTV